MVEQVHQRLVEVVLFRVAQAGEQLQHKRMQRHLRSRRPTLPLSAPRRQVFVQNVAERLLETREQLARAGRLREDAAEASEPHVLNIEQEVLQPFVERLALLPPLRPRTFGLHIEPVVFGAMDGRVG